MKKLSVLWRLWKSDHINWHLLNQLSRGEKVDGCTVELKYNIGYGYGDTPEQAKDDAASLYAIEEELSELRSSLSMANKLAKAEGEMISNLNLERRQLWEKLLSARRMAASYTRMLAVCKSELGVVPVLLNDLVEQLDLGWSSVRVLSELAESEGIKIHKSTGCATVIMSDDAERLVAAYRRSASSLQSPPKRKPRRQIEHARSGQEDSLQAQQVPPEGTSNPDQSCSQEVVA